MRDIGWLLVALGVCVLVGSFFVTTSTHVGYLPYSAYAPAVPADVSNLYGMHVQMALVVVGVGSILTGTIAIAADAIVVAIHQLKATAPESEAAAPAYVEPAARAESGSSEATTNNAETGTGVWLVVTIVVLIIAAVLAWSVRPGDSDVANAASANAMDAANAAVADLQNATAEMQAAADNASR
jgi:hypothetical protein